MANTLIIYYSLEGNIDFVSRALQKEIGADIFRLETEKEYPKKGLLKFFHGGKDSLKKATPKLKESVPSLSQYQVIVIGCPVWAGKPAAPINTFLQSADLSGKKVFAFASSAGGNAQNCLDILTNEVKSKGAIAEKTESFTNPAKNPEAALEKIKAFAQIIAAS